MECDKNIDEESSESVVFLILFPLKGVPNKLVAQV